jgi:ubiquinone/menaquinone biosynthesis C-methylase UbiE
LLSGKDEIPLENESIDLLITVNTLHEFSDKKKTIEEIRRVLKPEGQAVIINFKKEDTGFGPPVAIRVSQIQAMHLFEEGGFTVVKSHEFLYHYLIVFRRV